MIAGHGWWHTEKKIIQWEVVGGGEGGKGELERGGGCRATQTMERGVVGSVSYPPILRNPCVVILFHSSKDRISEQVVRVLDIHRHDMNQRV